MVVSRGPIEFWKQMPVGSQWGTLIDKWARL